MKKDTGHKECSAVKISSNEKMVNYKLFIHYCKVTKIVGDLLIKIYYPLKLISEDFIHRAVLYLKC